ncbi:MAG TPA: VOC family protein [Streptosporangiaceae bacterium]
MSCGDAGQVQESVRGTPAPALRPFVAWYVAFGFEETAVYADGDIVHHAELSWPPGGGIMLGSAKRPDTGDSGPVQPGGFSAYVVTGEPDALFARATAAGATVVRELHETDYGSRDFAVLDPEGNNWYFGTYPGHPRKS